MTTTEALQQHAPDILAIAELNNDLKAQLQSAMKHYTQAKAEEFARFFYEGAYFYSLREKPFGWDAYTQEHPLE